MQCTKIRIAFRKAAGFYCSSHAYNYALIQKPISWTKSLQLIRHILQCHHTSWSKVEWIRTTDVHFLRYTNLHPSSTSSRAPPVLSTFSAVPCTLLLTSPTPPSIASTLSSAAVVTFLAVLDEVDSWSAVSRSPEVATEKLIILGKFRT